MFHQLLSAFCLPCGSFYAAICLLCLNEKAWTQFRIQSCFTFQWMTFMHLTWTINELQPCIIFIFSFFTSLYDCFCLLVLTGPLCSCWPKGKPRESCCLKYTVVSLVMEQKCDISALHLNWIFRNLCPLSVWEVIMPWRGVCVAIVTRKKSSSSIYTTGTEEGLKQFKEFKERLFKLLYLLHFTWQIWPSYSGRCEENWRTVFTCVDAESFIIYELTVIL